MSAATVRKMPLHSDDSLSAVPHPPRVPDGEYLALCTHVHHDKQSRNYGERVYLDFQLCDCAHEGKIIRMFLRPSRFPTSNFYRSWAIARGGPPSRNAKMSARVFSGKLFRVLASTVKPKHRLTGDDGKTRPGPFLPESFWYSKVACLLSLEATNEAVVPITTLNTTYEGGAAPCTPVILTNFSPNPFSESGLSEGEVGSRNLGIGGMRESSGFAVRMDTNAGLHNQPVEAGSLPAPSPQVSGECQGDIERQKEILRRRGFLP